MSAIHRLDRAALSDTHARVIRMTLSPAHRSSIAVVMTFVFAIAGCGTLSPAVEEVNQVAKTAEEAAEDTKEAAPQIRFANGESNWIITEGFTRVGRAITFKEVQIDGNGWLVVHPFKDGRPNGAIHVGASYLRDGLNRDVTVNMTQAAEPQTGEMFLVMLHSDVNEDQVFDFVFVDERNVLDKAVFEGMTMIAHIFSAP